MQNNEFEKQIRQKLEELKLIPTTSVWDKVEATLPKERKRRWLIFILLFAALSTATLLWLNNDLARRKNIAQLPQQKNNITANEVKNNNGVLPGQAEIKNGPEPGSTVPKNNQVTAARPDNDIKSGNKQFIAVTQSNSNDLTTANKNETKENLPVKNNLDPASPRNNDEKKYMENYLKEPSVSESLAKLKLTIQSPGTDENKTAKPVIENDFKESNKQSITTTPVSTTTPSSTTEEKKEKKLVVTATGKADSVKNAVASKTPNKKKVDPWQYSFQIGAGIPYTKNGINSTVFITNSYRLGPSVMTINKPSDPSPGLVFQTGIAIEKNIVGRLDVRTGLGYTILSNNIKVGNKINSLSGNGYSAYENGDVIYYNNHFHLVQLPLALQFNMIKNDQISFFLEGGASLDYLANSNALLFDAVTNTYSTSKSIFNKFQYTALGGIGVKTAKQTKIPVTVGYQFSYGLNPFFKNADVQQHLPVSLVYFRIYLKR